MNNITFKKTEVVMLPTNQKANLLLGLCPSGKLIHYGNVDIINTEDTQKQHLYFLSDTEPTAYTWCMERKFVMDNNRNMNTVYIKPVYLSKENLVHPEFYKRIIATTDSSLTIERKYQGAKTSWFAPLPEPSQLFLEKFALAYNRGNIITDVLVGYWLDKNGMEYFNNLKIGDKNSISIRRMKENWTRRELVPLFKKHEEDVIKYINSSSEKAQPTFNEQWIDKHLDCY